MSSDSKQVRIREMVLCAFRRNHNPNRTNYLSPRKIWLSFPSSVRARVSERELLDVIRSMVEIGTLSWSDGELIIAKNAPELHSCATWVRVLGLVPAPGTDGRFAVFAEPSGNSIALLELYETRPDASRTAQSKSQADANESKFYVVDLADERIAPPCTERDLERLALEIYCCGELVKEVAPVAVTGGAR